MSHLANYTSGIAVAILFCFSRLTSAQDMPQATAPASLWLYGGFVDLGYSLDFNHPANGVFRGRGTVWHVDEVDLNMAAAYVKKKTSHQSRGGTELAAQAGRDSEEFRFSPPSPHFSPFTGL